MHEPQGLTWSAGRFRLDLLDGGRLRLDGGAVYRVLPRPLWERFGEADERNRVQLAMRPLLIRWAERVVLVDAGIGPDRRDARFAERAGIEGGPGLEAELQRLGLAPDAVDTVILTHLHYDHAGGLVAPGAGGALQARFPRAQVVVQRAELEDAREDCGLCRASYVEEDFALLEAQGQLRAVEGDVELAPGLRLEVSGGHTRAHQVVRVADGGETTVFWGDLVPTTAHLKPHYVLGFDLYPRASWEVKRRLLPFAIEGGWTQVFYHDLERPVGRVVGDLDDPRWEPLE